MLQNRSVPVDTVLPHIVYKDLPRRSSGSPRRSASSSTTATATRSRALNCTSANACIMVNAAQKRGQQSPSDLGYGTQSLDHLRRGRRRRTTHATRAAGANIVEELHETVYGELQYGVRDLEGHHWLFSRHARDVDPAAWGATVVNPE